MCPVLILKKVIFFNEVRERNNMMLVRNVKSSVAGIKSRFNNRYCRFREKEYVAWKAEYVDSHTIWIVETYNTVTSCEQEECKEGIASVTLVSADTKDEAALKYLRGIDPFEFFKLLCRNALPDAYYLPLHNRMVEEGWDYEPRSEMYNALDEFETEELETLRNKVSDEEILGFYGKSDEFAVWKPPLF